MIDFTKTFDTEKIHLRPLMANDYHAFSQITAPKEMFKYFTHDLSDPGVLQEWVNSALDEIKNKTRLALTLIYKPNNQIIGSTSIGNISVRDRRVEIGWTWLGKEHQRKGINAVTKQKLLEYCFNSAGVMRVEFKTDVLNLPARNSLSGIGAIEEGILRSHTLMTGGRRRDTIYYGIILADWEQRPGI